MLVLKKTYVCVTLILLVIATVVGSLFYPKGQSPVARAIEEFYELQLDPGELGLVFMGESTFLIKTSSRTIAIDPANKISGDDVERLEKLDLILITHEHRDHFDPSSTLAIQKKTDAFIFANPGSYRLLQEQGSSFKLVEMKPGDKKGLPGIEVRAVSASHPSSSPLMYTIVFERVSLFHGSDSGFNTDLLKYQGQVLVAIVPTGDPSPTASPTSALEMVKALQPQVAITMHGTAAQHNALKDLLKQELPKVQFVCPENLKPFKVKP